MSPTPRRPAPDPRQHPAAMNDGSFSAHLRAGAAGVWEAQHTHPFLRGIADGTLSTERFEHFLRQDYVFLIDYARLLGLGAARAPDLSTMRRFAELTGAVLSTEMDLHRSFAGELGITGAQLEAEVAAPTTRGYMDFLVRTAAVGDLTELAGALLPCMWGYCEIGERLAAAGRSPQESYARWVDAYASPDFAQLAQWCRGLVDQLAEGAPPPVLARVQRAFDVSSRYELAFWEMAWTMERWPH